MIRSPGYPPVRVVAGKDGKDGTNGTNGTDGRGWVSLPDITLQDGGLIAVAGVRRKTYACAGAVVGDRLSAFATAGTPAGYVIGDACCTTAGQITVSFSGPALVVLTNNQIPLKVVAFR